MNTLTCPVCNRKMVAFNSASVDKHIKKCRVRHLVKRRRARKRKGE